MRAFLGIRYARARRWSEPVLTDAAEAIGQSGPACPQPDLPRGPIGCLLVPRVAEDEDCLFLDVYTPDGGEPRPVVVYIHGGGFTYGAGSAVPLTALAGAGVVAVGINYRLGPFGFLHADGIPPNLGLQDQMAALRWLQRHIEEFGGDPANVTVLGHSAGAISAAALMAIPSAAGLFRRVISVSGSAEVALQPEQANAITDRLRQLTHPDLRVVTTDALAKATGRLEMEGPGLLAGAGVAMPLPFQPVIDGDVLPIRPLDAIARGSAAGIELLAGWCADELKVFAPEAPREMSDAWFGRPTERLCAAQAEHAGAFRYRMSWEGPHGACHGVDLALLLRAGDTLVGAVPPQHLASALQEAVALFATNGDPGWAVHPAVHEFVDDGRMR